MRHDQPAHLGSEAASVAGPFPDNRQRCDPLRVDDRVLHYWGEDGFYRIYPTSVPLTDEMTRKGRTTVVLKRPAPDWRPTPSMLERNPDLPR